MGHLDPVEIVIRVVMSSNCLSEYCWVLFLFCRPFIVYYTQVNIYFSRCPCNSKSWRKIRQFKLFNRSSRNSTTQITIQTLTISQKKTRYIQGYWYMIQGKIKILRNFWPSLLSNFDYFLASYTILYIKIPEKVWDIRQWKSYSQINCILIILCHKFYFIFGYIYVLYQCLIVQNKLLTLSVIIHVI